MKHHNYTRVLPTHVTLSEANLYPEGHTGRINKYILLISVWLLFKEYFECHYPPGFAVVGGGAVGTEVKEMKKKSLIISGSGYQREEVRWKTPGKSTVTVPCPRRCFIRTLIGRAITSHAVIGLEKIEWSIRFVLPVIQYAGWRGKGYRWLAIARPKGTVGKLESMLNFLHIHTSKIHTIQRWP